MNETECKYDLLLKDGHVIDPSNNIDKSMDVAIRGNKIAQVAEDISSSQARKIINVSGLYVTPGLIDIHVHLCGYAGWLFPDFHSFSNGVTTVVDAGGPGWKSFEEFKKSIIDTSKTRVLTLLNIVGAGMLGAVEQDVSEMEPIPAAEMIKKYPKDIVGAKTAHFMGSGWEAVDGAVRAAEMSGTIAMADFRPMPTRSYKDLLLSHLRPGDIHTHMYAQHIPLLNEQGVVNDYVWKARERGIIFDVGHGVGSFWWRVAVPAMKQGFVPDSISTDRHKASALIPNASMMITMSKFLNMGMPLPEVILRSTVNPARIIRRPELGTLSVGADADVAVIELLKGDFGFVDSGHAKMCGTQKLQASLTIRNGEIVWDLNGLSWPDWETAGQYTVINQ
ncbi:TPA: amidohydrolase/deacetylase family metallohydrolase [Candidatus Poribacteria bacterium]|nr:amidohydrolase/deacetylase family metallohydrolase [Candidatus Poribacteria bacterium]